MTYPRYIEPEMLRPESGEALDRKIDALLRALTPEEKLSLCHGGENPQGKRVANAGYLAGVPRLGIPELRMYDGPAGVTSIYETTGLPIQEMLASAWDPELAYRYGTVAGSENFAVSGNTQLGAQYDLVRTQHFSRNRDMLGEDPFLTASLAVDETRGIQDQHVIATVKHFAVASVGVDPQNAVDQLVDEQTLHELYFPPFEAAASDAGAFMCSYNRINGAYASGSAYLQKTVLRDYWNYQGFVMSDWGSNHALTLAKGMDMEMPVGAYNSNERILRGIERGRIGWDDVDAAVRHVLWGLGTVGYLALVALDADGNVIAEPGRTEPIALRDRYEEAVAGGLLDRNAQVCAEVARNGAVLLKNNGALPLTPADYTGENTVAMIGPGALTLFSGSGQERSYGRISRMCPPVQALRGLCGEDANIEASAGFNLFGTTIPSDCLYQDAACTSPGLVRTYGVDASNITPVLFPGAAAGGNGVEFKGTATADEDDEPIPFLPNWANELAADMPGHETGSFCCVDAAVEFTCGTIGGAVNRTYKNSADGTAFVHGDAYTWDGYLRVPTDGEYRLILQAIGGNSDFKIDLDGTGFVSIGSTELREGAQWPWGYPVCTPEGMEVRGAILNLKADTAYPIRLCIHATLVQKDLQVRLAWVQPEQRMVDYAAALVTAAKAKKVIFFLSENYALEPLGQGNPFEMMRCNSLEIPDEQLRLLHNVKGAMQPDAQLIVVVNHGLVYALGSVEPIADAMLNIWLPGQEGGQAIAELLTGQVNPSGKLPQTIPYRNEDTPITDTPDRLNQRYQGYEKDGRVCIDFDEGIFTGYRWHDREGIAPLYAFGHGLSYTTFAYSALTVQPDGDGFLVRFSVTNTGSRTGTEIAQVYLGAAVVPAGIQMAAKQLCGFARLEDLAPGQTQQAEIRIPARSLCYWDPNAPLATRADGKKDKWVRAAGTRTVLVGPSSAQLPLQAEITVS